MWKDVAMLMFSCVMMIHMGLVDAILYAIHMDDKRVLVVTCPKCSTFWVVLAYMTITRHNVISCFAMSFLASYCALWFDLFLGQMDVLYEYIYEKIRTDNDTNIHNKDDR